MTHKLLIRDIVAISYEVNLPDKCKRCGADFGPGSGNVKCWHLRPYFDKVRLTKVMSGGKETDVVETVPTKQVSVTEPWTRLPAIYKCGECGLTLARYHSRTYNLLEMSEADAFKLQGLLYDSNVLDPVIRAKVWANYFGSHGCTACILEATLGTEEVPHPIDARVHSCKRNA